MIPFRLILSTRFEPCAAAIFAFPTDLVDTSRVVSQERKKHEKIYSHRANDAAEAHQQ